MDSKVQKAVFNTVDLLLTRLEDNYGASKADLWALWKSMFNFPEEIQPKKKTTSSKATSSTSATSASSTSATSASSTSAISASSTSAISASSSAATSASSSALKKTASKSSGGPATKKPRTVEKSPIVASSSSTAAAVVEKSPVVSSKAAVVEKSPVVSPKAAIVEKSPVVSPKVDVAPEQKDVEMDAAESVDPMEVSAGPQEEEFPELESEPQVQTPVVEPQQEGCVFLIVKGARKGQMCGEIIGKAFQDIKMCRVHGKKQ